MPHPDDDGEHAERGKESSGETEHRRTLARGELGRLGETVGTSDVGGGNLPPLPLRIDSYLCRGVCERLLGASLRANKPKYPHLKRA